MSILDDPSLLTPEGVQKPVQTPVERQRWLRIRLSVAAYAYEFESSSIMTDGEFDRLCLEVDLTVTTGNRKLDNFFRKHFDPSTGQWVHKHPEKHKLKSIYERFHNV